MSYAKNWVFTINNPEHDMDFRTVPDCLYMVYGHENAPSTGTPHLQGYVMFSKRKTFKSVQAIFPRAYIAIARGTPSQNYEYCSKDHADVKEFGDRVSVTQGKRSDLLEVAEAVRSGALDSYIAEHYPAFALRYGPKALDNYRRMMHIPSLRLGIQVIVIVGESGVGKTRWAFDKYGIDNVYTVNPNHNKTLWFDGYVRQKVLLIDDYDGWIDFRTLLKLLDIYPYLCQIKGSCVWAQWETVVITSERQPIYWYPTALGKFDQIQRRISQVLVFDKEFSKFVELPETNALCQTPITTQF